MDVHRDRARRDELITANNKKGSSPGIVDIVVSKIQCPITLSWLSTVLTGKRGME